MAQNQNSKLVPLSLFVQTYPPREPFRLKQSKVVYQHAFSRWVLHREETGDIGYGLWREERLADEGHFGSELDAKNFSTDLVEALSPHLSLRELRLLAQALEQEIREQEQQRQALASRMS